MSLRNLAADILPDGVRIYAYWWNDLISDRTPEDRDPEPVIIDPEEYEWDSIGCAIGDTVDLWELNNIHVVLGAIERAQIDQGIEAALHGIPYHLGTCPRLFREGYRLGREILRHSI